MNPVALITGASRGIGRGIALELARLGYDLALNYVANHEAVQQTATDCEVAAGSAGHTITTEPCLADLALGQDRQELVESVRRRFGRLDLLVNNAGIAPAVRSDLLETTEESLDRLLSVNTKGPLFLTQQVARWMLEELEAVPAGVDYRPKIVFISSISAFTASVNRADYCLSKAAVSMMTQLFAVRLAEAGIRVYEIRPGIIETDMTQPVRERYDREIAAGLLPIRRWGTPDDVGKAVAAIAQDLLPYSTGEVLHVDGGFHLRRL